MSEEKTKKRVRKTLTEQIAEKEERIKALRAEAARLKRRASAKERKARTHLLIKYGAELFNALQINIDDLLKKENSEQVIRQQIEKQVILHTIGNEILQKTGISAADLIADPRVNAQFFRFLQQADQLLFAHFPKMLILAMMQIFVYPMLLGRTGGFSSKKMRLRSLKMGLNAGIRSIIT